MYVWRKIGKVRRELIRRKVDSLFKKRLEDGSKEYPLQIFQGDPLDHALEEVLDTAFYLVYAAQEREQLLWLRDILCDECRKKDEERNGIPAATENQLGELASFARGFRRVYEQEKKTGKPYELVK